MDKSKISKEEHEAINKAILEGDVHQLEQFLIAFNDDAFVKQWNELLISHSMDSANFYEKACTIIAFKHNFNNWSEYNAFMKKVDKGNSEVALFEQAADMVVAGDIIALKELMEEHPGLVLARSMRKHHSTLLNYVGANGVESFRQKTPPNAVEVAESLLNAGAVVDSIGDMYRGTTTLGLVATSVHPVKAGVQKELIDVLLKYGADINHAVAHDYTNGLLILACLHNGRREIVSYLAEKGAMLDLEAAAGVGALDEVKKYYTTDGFLKQSTDAGKRDLGFIWACEGGHSAVVEFMLTHGIDVHTIADGVTGLHAAVLGGHMDIIQLLLELKAPLEIKNNYGGTVLGQALWFAMNEPKPQDAMIIDMLIRSGANIEPGWEKHIDAIKARY